MQKIIQNSFLGGQLDFEMMGRQDFAKYRKGASKLVNFNLLKRGGITKRQGFDHILDLYSDLGIPSSAKVRLVPFAYKKDHGMVLIFAGGVGCWAVYTMKGIIHSTWTVPCPSDVGMFTNTEIGEFDYAQCGYKLFIAHQNHAPSEIWTNETLMTKAAGDGTASPLMWEKFDITGTDTGIPSITGATQERVAPTEDTEGAKYTEKYKVSAVFDDRETKPCSEFYNESFVPVTELTAASGGTLTGYSSSTADEYTSRTYSGETSTSVTSRTEVEAVTNTGKTYVNRKYGSCNGTCYYMPWTESQTIKLAISAAAKTSGSATVYPDRINIYKRASSYYGLIGTLTSDQGLSGEIYKSLTTSGVTKVNSDNLENSTKYTRGYDEDTSLSAYTSTTDSHGNGKTGHCVTSSGSITIRPTGTMLSTSTLRLLIGKAKMEFTEWYSDASADAYYNKPIAATFSLVASTCTSVIVSAACTYTKEVSGVESEATATISGTATISATPSVTQGTYPSSGSVTYKVFAKNYAKQYSTWLSGITSSTETSINLNSVLGSAISALADKKSGTTVKLTSITLTPASGTLTVNGIAVSGSNGSSFEFTDNNITPDNSITPISSDWEMPFQGGSNYPASVAVYQQRLVWASSKNEPETVWMSAVGDFYDYTEHEIQNDDDAIEFSMPVTRFAKLNHIVEMKRLIAFNSACEWLIDSSSSQKGITYETIRAMPQSYSGSNARMKPLICNNSLVFVERTGQAVRRFAYTIQEDGFAGRDISILSSSIFERNSIIDWTYQQNPFSTVWCVLSDGTLASLSLMEEQDIIAWATHEHGDPNATFEAIATSFAVSPSLADIESSTDEPYTLATTDEVFAVVNHNGTRTLERMRVRSKAEDTIYNSVCMDSVKIASATTTLSTGQVGVNPTTGAVTTSGSVPTGTIIGYPFESKFTSVYPMLGDQYIGGGQFAIKNLNNLHLRLEASEGGSVAATRIESQSVPIRYDDDKSNDCSPTFSDGTAKFNNCDAANCHPIGCNNRDGRITICQSDPWPFTLLSYEAEYAVENERYTAR